MEQLSTTLKQQREALNLSLEALSAKTKISILQLQAIEEGNLSFFADDITYFPFIVKAIVLALGLDYADFRQDVTNIVNQYHHTAKLQVIKEHQEINESIKRRVIQSKPKNKKKKIKWDFTFISLVTILVALLLSLTYVFGVYVLPILQNGNNQNNPGIVDLPDNPNNQDDEVDQGDPDDFISQLEVVRVSNTDYELVNYADQEEVKISVLFNVDTWVRVFIDDVATDNPRSTTYPANSTIEVFTNAKDNHKITLHVGVVRSNIFSVNDQVIELDNSVANLTYGVRFNFTFKGE